MFVQCSYICCVSCCHTFHTILYVYAHIVYDTRTYTAGRVCVLIKD